MRPAILLCVLTFGCDDAEPQDEPTRDVGIDAALDAAPPEPDASTPEPDMAGPEPDMSAPDPDGAPPEPDAAPGPLDAPCNTAAGELPEGLVELRWDDGTPVGDVAAQDWEIAGLALKDAEMHEAVRFELAHPARIHGFSVQFGTVPPRETWSVEVGLYPDFGANGFDFWQFDPLWEGSRCAGDITPGQWVTYAFDEPVEVPHPGLVYVGHRRGHLFDPAFLFDGTPPEGCESNDCCGPFDACHSAWNFPELTSFQGTPFFNGLSTTFLYDYMVRLHVEYTEEADPAEDLFQPIEGAPQPSNRMAWGDYDNDGDDDLLVNGPRLYRNDGGGAFTEVTEESGLVGDWHGAGTWGDYDNDGCLDFFLFDEAYNRSDHLFRGDCEGGFADVTEQSGIVDVQDYNLCDDPANDRSPSPAAAWIDVDADGLLDLYVANFICWSPGTYYADQIWHNEGDGTFTERTGLDGWAGLEDPRLASRGTSPIDIDQDGDVDLLVSTYRLHPNRFYVNQGDGAVAQQAGSAAASPGSGSTTPSGTPSAPPGATSTATATSIWSSATSPTLVSSTSRASPRCCCSRTTAPSRTSRGTSSTPPARRGCATRRPTRFRCSPTSTRTGTSTWRSARRTTGDRATSTGARATGTSNSTSTARGSTWRTAGEWPSRTSTTTGISTSPRAG